MLAKNTQTHKTRRKAYITHDEISKDRARGTIYIGERKEVLSVKFREEVVRKIGPHSCRVMKLPCYEMPCREVVLRLDYSVLKLL